MGKRKQDDDRPHWSVSSINQYLNVCGLQFWFERIAKIPKETESSNLILGSAVHETISCFYDHLRSGHPLTPDTTVEAFSAVWDTYVGMSEVQVLYSGKNTFDTLRAKGEAMMRHFVEHVDPDERVHSVDQRFHLPLIAQDGSILEMPLLGYFDLVIEREGVPVVVDFKTASRRYTDSKIDNDLQSIGYGYVGSMLFDQEEVTFEWRVLLKTKAPAIETYSTTLGAGAFERFVHLAQVVEHGVRSEVFLPNTQSYYCGSCAYRGACKDWHCGQSMVEQSESVEQAVDAGLFDAAPAVHASAGVVG